MAQTPFVTGKRFGNLQNSLASSKWKERILNADGSINWTQYNNVAKNYNRADIIDYRYGPRYTDYYSNPGSFPTVPQTGSNGWAPSPWNYSTPQRIDWSQMSGQLLYSPDDPNDAGIAKARNGSTYCTNGSPSVITDLRIQWTPDEVNYYNENPDAVIRTASWASASGGKVPNTPVAVARSRYMRSPVGITAFINGLVGITPTGNEPNTWESKFPFVKLAPGKIPTDIVMTINHEFALVTVWDTVNRKGQVAVITLEGELPVGYKAGAGPGPYWSMPNWEVVTGLKLLGYVDLPFAAPTSIQTSADIGVDMGRNVSDLPTNPDFNQQYERDRWNNWTGGYYRRTARAGYAIVASRAENKVAFVDLQPLFQYVRTMMFTTQSNFDATKNRGMADSQWPHTFSHAPQQKPVVASVISVPSPSAVAAGFPKDGAFWWNFSGWSDDTFRTTAFVASMDGSIRMYNVGDLNTGSGGASTPSLFKTINVGKNPTHISFGVQGGPSANRLAVTCRGDRAIYQLNSDGGVAKVLRDSRLIDPVSTEVSFNWRSCGGVGILSVIDFGGKQAVNYVTTQMDGYSVRDVGFLFGFATPVPGMPFLFTVSEVI